MKIKNPFEDFVIKKIELVDDLDKKEDERKLLIII